VNDDLHNMCRDDVVAHFEAATTPELELKGDEEEE
jgi:hypothetical protein